MMPMSGKIVTPAHIFFTTLENSLLEAVAGRGG
jgi:hypothetical protein